MGRGLVYASCLILMGCGVDSDQGYQRRRDLLVDELEVVLDRAPADKALNLSAVLKAMRRVPRHRFVPDEFQAEAYANHPLPIGYGQTISQPLIVAMMTVQLDLQGDEKVLEIGTGSGYQAAVLAELAREVYSIEIVEPLGRRAADTLFELGYRNVHVRVGDGYQGWPEEAPFDAVILTAAPDHIPQPLLDQLREGGRMILPLGAVDEDQQLCIIRKTGAGIEREYLDPVRFVPMTGEAARCSP